MKKFVDKYLQNFSGDNIKILDIGSQDINGSYRDLFNHRGWNYIGLDMSEGRNVDIVIKDPYSWKEIKSNYFEVVITGQTLEHIEYPWLTMCEISRILKYNGLCCVIVPSSGPEHKYPIDCYRFFPDGLKALANYANLAIIECYNCWEDDPNYIGGNIFKDTVLICSKENKNILTKIKYNITNSLCKRISL